MDLPAKGSKLLAALPFALEDLVADEIENLHFAPGKRLPSGKLPVAVVAHDVITRWLDDLRELGIRPVRMVPEIHGLARVPNTMSMLVGEKRILFNDGADIEFALEGVTPGDVVAAAGVFDTADGDADEDDSEEQEQRSRHLLVYCEPGLEQRYQNDWDRAARRTRQASTSTSYRTACCRDSR